MIRDTKEGFIEEIFWLIIIVMILLLIFFRYVCLTHRFFIKPMY